MSKVKLWDKEQEKTFFEKTLEIISHEKLFYKINEDEYLAYWPKGYKGKKTTLQSRNSFIGNYTEKWVKELLNPLSKEINAYVMTGVVCKEIGVEYKSPLDVAIVKTPELDQKAKNILLAIEVKMSIVWNWRYNPQNKRLVCIGDFKTHQGNPSLLRSDTMLKAIGKSINIRVSGPEASKIPIIIIGNAPITKTYFKKVDFLKKAGIIQGFFSVNSNPLDKSNDSTNIKSTPGMGFLRVDNIDELFYLLKSFIKEEKEYFSGMLSKEKLGKIIDLASKEIDYKKKAEKFLNLLKNSE